MKQLLFTAVCLVCAVGEAQDLSERSRAAVVRSLPGILRGAASYPEHRQCFSCHHQALPLMALTEARARGLTVDESRIDDIVSFSLKSFGGEERLERVRNGVGHRTSVIGYMLAAMAAVDHPPDATTSAMVQYMLLREDPAGAWRDSLQRPPGQGSSFTVTAVTLWGFRKFGGADDLRPLAPKIQQAQEKGLQWLLENEPRDTEDRVFQLLGLVIGEADARTIHARREALIKEQRVDGSWSQLPDLEGDAYATGSALAALRRSGLPADDAAFVRGAEYLLKTQQADGSWFVQTRARLVQPFFDNGDPGGKSQFICFAATNWAVLALLESVPTTRTIEGNQ